MIKNLTRHGNSLALVIEKPVLELLGMNADTPVRLTTDGKRLIVARVRARRRAAECAEALAEGNRRYGKMLKRLAG